MWANFGAVVGLVRACLMSLVFVLRIRPRAVVSVGGFASFPMSLAAVLLRRPLILVELDRHASAAQRLVQSRAAARCTAFSDPSAHVTGAPVSPELESLAGLSKEDARRRLHDPVAAQRRIVTVMTGSLGASRVNRAVRDLAQAWRTRDDLTVVHITGRREYEAYRESSFSGEGLEYRVIPFGDMTQWWPATDLAITRAGAMTVAELSLFAIPAIVVPLPGAPGDHQTANAEALAETGGAVVLRDRDCTADALATHLETLLSEGRLEDMAATLRARRHVGAASAIASVIESVLS
jgi:UDP-N-acetylglucosamine--N-acetylmuramyl-(pentapeptide) pyrophosphoryl-undecaprenol N-acetylglucosamine transferase